MPCSLTVFLAKIIERISNGTFASPRDAYVAEQATDNKGFALSLISVSKTAGCILGPLLVSLAALFLWGNITNHIHWFISLCCLMCLLAFSLSFFIQSNLIKEAKISISEIKSTFKELSPIIIIGTIFFLARFNDGVLLIYLKKKNFPEWFYLSTLLYF